MTGDTLVGDGLSSLLNLARMGIAWIASWVSMTVIRTTNSTRLPARSGPMTSQRSGSSPGVFDCERIVDGVMDVLVDDTVLSRRLVDLHCA